MSSLRQARSSVLASRDGPRLFKQDHACLGQQFWHQLAAPLFHEPTRQQFRAAGSQTSKLLSHGQKLASNLTAIPTLATASCRLQFARPFVCIWFCFYFFATATASQEVTTLIFGFGYRLTNCACLALVLLAREIKRILCTCCEQPNCPLVPHCHLSCLLMKLRPEAAFGRSAGAIAAAATASALTEPAIGQTAHGRPRPAGAANP